MQFNHLFSPIQIGPMQVKNRFVVPPMANNFANTDGTLSERSLQYYQERAKGGFGLITIEASVVDPTSKAGHHKPCLFDDSVTDSFGAVGNACHTFGAKVSVQLQHAGPEGNSTISGHPLRAASAIPAAPGKEIPVPLTVEEIHALVRRYGDAAVRAQKAGLDAVEIHCAHGYLLHSFLSPRTNLRNDEFGGCVENRLRIVRLILQEVRQRTQGELAVLCRINACDDIPDGLQVSDSAVIARLFEEYGADAIDLSRAVHQRDDRMWAPREMHGGFSAALITEIKQAISIPLIAVGRFTDPYYPELLLEQNRADLIAFGRQSIADPDTPRKIAENRVHEIHTCTACLQGCVKKMFAGEPITCLRRRSPAERSTTNV